MSHLQWLISLFDPQFNFLYRITVHTFKRQTVLDNVWVREEEKEQIKVSHVYETKEGYFDKVWKRNCSDESSFIHRIEKGGIIRSTLLFRLQINPWFSNLSVHHSFLARFQFDSIPSHHPCLFSPFLIHSRWIQLSAGRSHFQTRIQLLFDSNLHSVLHVGYRFLGFILVGSQCNSCPSIFGCYNPFNHGHTNIGYQCFPPSCQLHQSHRCLVRDLCSNLIWINFSSLHNNESVRFRRTGVCLTFVFGALLEFALVNYASRTDAHKAAALHYRPGYGQRRWDADGNVTDDGMPPPGYPWVKLIQQSN